jgi:hypothetical protein
MFAAFAYQQWTALAIDFAQLFYFRVRTPMRFQGKTATASESNSWTTTTTKTERAAKRLQPPAAELALGETTTTTETEPLPTAPADRPDPKKNVAKACALRHRPAV